jgi:hypothetical protein
MSIINLLAKKISNYDNPYSIGSRFRTKRAIALLHLIEKNYQDHGSVNIADIGGTEKYWNIIPDDFLEKNYVNITLVNLPGSVFVQNNPRFNYIEADGCDLKQFADKSFHIAHSNSVIEHVGNWNRMVSFAREISRIAFSYFVQTPNFWFPIEPHFMVPFFHWMPKPIQITLVMNFDLGQGKKALSVKEAARTVASIRLLKENEFCELFQDALIEPEFLFCLKKSFVAIKE